MPRATPMPADERRAALIAVTEPLLEQFGREVSTRQIAEAAEVAEGTIFRVFPSKEALISAVCDQVFDMGPTLAQLEAIEGETLGARLIEAVTLMRGRLRRVFTLFHALQLESKMGEHWEEHRARQQADNVRLTAALCALVEPDRALLRMPIAEAAESIRVMTMAFTNPWVSPQTRKPEQIVDLVLHGLMRGDRC